MWYLAEKETLEWSGHGQRALAAHGKVVDGTAWPLRGASRLS